MDTNNHSHEMVNSSTSCHFSGNSTCSYVIQSDMPQVATQSSSQEKQVVPTVESYTQIQSQILHLNKEAVHKLKSSKPVKSICSCGDINEEKHVSSHERNMAMKMLNCVPSSDLITPTDHYANCNLLAIRDEMLPECSLSLNPSHFDPID